MACTKIVSFAVVVIITTTIVNGLELRAGAYEDLVITLEDSVPSDRCTEILKNLEATLSGASQFLFSALDSRAYFRSATVVLPPTWPDSCAPSPVVSGVGETTDVTVLPRGPARGRIWTQQSLGCGQPGDQIYLTYESLENRDDSLARSFIKEFSKYRYGIFEEQGYHNDPVYPLCFYDDQNKEVKVTGCSDLRINDNGFCHGTNSEYNTTSMININARKSIMFAAEAPSVSQFCDEGNHDRFAPTKHNFMCQQRNTLDVINSHQDFTTDNFVNSQQNSQITNTTPKITYKKQHTTRYVLVIENTKDMLQRESWNYLRFAIRKWALYDLPSNTEVGLILTNETSSTRILNILSMKSSGNEHDINHNRDLVSSSIPYTPGDSSQPACLHCALKDAMDMLNERTRTRGPASSVIVLIAPGTHLSTQLKNVLRETRKSKIKIATITYPKVIRPLSLDFMAEETRGQAFTVNEQILNIDTSRLSTYFQLTNVLYTIVQRFYAGNIADLPMEIHRREIKDDSRSSVTGSFMLDPNMGEPARFMLYTHNSDAPLIKGLKLISPSHQVFESRSDNMLTSKIIKITSNISETGTWTYTVEPYAGNPQPHFLQVMATPTSPTAPVVRARFWTYRNQHSGPLILLAEVKRGNSPVLGAKVEVTITKPETNGSIAYKERLELPDTGSGDPDVTKGDGVYSRYFSAAIGGPGVYTFEVVVTDNGNTAYSWLDVSKYDDTKACCGSLIPTTGVQPLSPFQRVLPPVTLQITSEDILLAGRVPAGRIGDLKVEVIPEDMKARLSWTAPDMGGHSVTRYEIRYATSVEDIVDKFDTSAVEWEYGLPFPLAPGSETTFTLDMSKDKELLDKPLYFAIRAFSKMTGDLQSAPFSNWVRVLVPSPPPPPTVPPTYPSNDQSSWPFQVNSNRMDPVSPSITKTSTFGLELILPIAIGFILLVILLILYCYFCIIKRRTRDGHKKSSKHKDSIKNDKMNSNITIVPSSPAITPPQSYTTTTDIPDPHTIGVPVNNYGYEDETKKRYSLVHQQEQQLIEELKQQQIHHQQQREQMNTPSNNYGGLSVISNNTLQRNGHTLSPYNSWSASQLLHEHERRHSPMENMMQDEQMLPPQHQDMLMGGSQIDHMSLNGQNLDHLSLSGHNPMPEHYNQPHIPPPVPPLPAFNGNGYPVNYNIYGVMPAAQQNHPIYQTMQRNEPLIPFNASLQGSMSSVNSGEKKRRNVTMV